MWNLLRSDVYRFLHTRSTQIVTLLYVLMLILLVSTTGVVSNTAYASFDASTDSLSDFLTFFPKSLVFLFLVLLAHVLLVSEEYQSGYAKNLYPYVQNKWKLAASRLLSFVFIWGLFAFISILYSTCWLGFVCDRWGTLSASYLVYLFAQFLYALLLAGTATLLVHLIRGRILPVLFVLLQPCGVFWGLQVMLMQHFSLDYGRYLPYMLSGVLPMQWANEPYLQLFLIVGVSLLLAYIGNVLVLKKKDL